MYKRIIEADIEDYELDKKAREMSKLFHVTISAFDCKHDREGELAQGLMQSAYMMSGLRSFAWTLADYCKQQNCTPENVNNAMASQIANFVAKEDWLNYDGDNYCQGLCSGSDLHVFFIPDSITQTDKNKFLPSKEDKDRVKKMKEKFPTYREILSEVHSLDSLRKDLEYVYPAVKTLWNGLAEERDYSVALLGNEADIVYAWCALALAAKEPFFFEDGPMTCFFDHPTDEPVHKIKKEKTNSVNGLKDNGKSASEFNEEKPQNTHAKKEKRDIDFNKYSQYLTKDPKIIFESKSFAFLGTRGNELERFSYFAQSIIREGGKYYNKLSSRVDYLVVNPENLGTGTTLKTAVKYINDGEKIQIILEKDLDSALEQKKAEKNIDSHGFAIKGDKLIAYYGTDEDAIIPQGVRVICDGAFAESKIKYVKAPDSINEIRIGAFASCKNLKKADLPDNLMSIGDNAFEFCVNLESIEIPSSIKNLGAGAFYKCESLKKIVFPEKLNCPMELKQNLFYHCHSILSIKLPRNITKICDYAFSSCYSLKDIILPTELKEIGYSAFDKCSSIEKIEIPYGVTNLKRYAFSNCSNLAYIFIPDSVTEISSHAFDRCPMLKNITIPEKCRYDSRFVKIDVVRRADYKVEGSRTAVNGQTDSYFYGKDSNLTVINSYTPDLGKNTYLPTSNNQQENLKTGTPEELSKVDASPKSMQEYMNHDYEYDFGAFNVQNGVLISYSGNASYLMMPLGVTEIGSAAFSFNEKLVAIKIPASVTKISMSAFQGCSKLAFVQFSVGIASINPYAFSLCDNLRHVVFLGNGNALSVNSFSSFNDNVTVYGYSEHIKDIASQRLTNFERYGQATENSTETEKTAPTPSPVTTQSSKQEKDSKQKKEGCYIATAVYGSYDAPEVMVLRKYRDEVLSKSVFGRLFIKTYYLLSPPVAKKLKNEKHINRLVKNLLDGWVKKLKLRYLKSCEKNISH